MERERFNAFSAGSDPKGTVHHPLALKTLVAYGLEHLKGKETALAEAVKALQAAVIAAKEPIIQAEIDRLAAQLIKAESHAGRLRARLYGYSCCADSITPQKLSWTVRSLLSSAPRNASFPQTNSPDARRFEEEKQAFSDWKKALESDANAQL
jgi:hypothetical protein